jgi:hypothetical protein
MLDEGVAGLLFGLGSAEDLGLHTIFLVVEIHTTENVPGAYPLARHRELFPHRILPWLWEKNQGLLVGVRSVLNCLPRLP